LGHMGWLATPIWHGGGSATSRPVWPMVMSGNFNGSIPDSIASLTQLVRLDLSYNSFTGSIPNSTIASLTQLVILKLHNNNFSGSIPNSIASLTKLALLNLSNNSFSGSIPFFSMCKNLREVRLDNNHLSGQITSTQWEELLNLNYIDLGGNSLNGNIPVSLFSLPLLQRLDRLPNQFYGQLSICNAIKLEFLDLSNNFLFGSIHDAFPHIYNLQVLTLSKNQLKGGSPKSLANCIGLEVLDMGNNHIDDTFPFYLKNTSKLKVLVLRYNKFYGPITHPELNATWPMLQIIDVASNNFIGNLPIIVLRTLMAMVNHESEPNYLETYLSYYYYQNMITVTSKHLEVDLVKILTSFTLIDFSCNGFDGPILEEIGEFKALYILNLSHNAFTGQIPSSLEKLSNLESLDLSSNKLFDKVPVQLANGLFFCQCSTFPSIIWWGKVHSSSNLLSGNFLRREREIMWLPFEITMHI